MSETWIVEGPDGFSREAIGIDEDGALNHAWWHGGTHSSRYLSIANIMRQAGYTARKKPVTVEVNVDDLEDLVSLARCTHAGRALIVDKLDRLKQKCADARKQI